MQILVAAVLFGVVFVMLGIAYSAVLNRCAFGQTFADMSSGISLRSILYDTPNNGKPFPETILIWLAYIFGTLLLSGVLIATGIKDSNSVSTSCINYCKAERQVCEIIK